MEFNEVVQARRTVRDFLRKEVPEEVLLRILEAGLRAPSNDHMRSWEFIVVRDPKQIATILSSIARHITDEDLANLYKAWNLNDACQREVYHYSVPRQFEMLAMSECLVIPLYRQSGKLLEADSLSHLNSFASIWCCIENILLAAANEGLGTALRIPFENDSAKILEVTGHPADYVVPCLLAFGYPRPDAPVLEQIPVDIRAKVHPERW